MLFAFVHKDDLVSRLVQFSQHILLSCRRSRIFGSVGGAYAPVIIGITAPKHFINYKAAGFFIIDIDASPGKRNIAGFCPVIEYAGPLIFLK